MQRQKKWDPLERISSFVCRGELELSALQGNPSDLQAVIVIRAIRNSHHIIRKIFSLAYQATGMIQIIFIFDAC